MEKVGNARTVYLYYREHTLSVLIFMLLGFPDCDLYLLFFPFSFTFLETDDVCGEVT